MPADGYATRSCSSRQPAARADRADRSARHRLPAGRGVRRRRHPRRRASRPVRHQPGRHRSGAAEGLPLDYRAPAGLARRRTPTAKWSSTTSSRASAPRAAFGSSSSSATRRRGCSTAASARGGRRRVTTSRRAGRHRMAWHAAGRDHRDLARRPRRLGRDDVVILDTRTPESTTARPSAPPAAARSPARSTSSGRTTSTPTAASSPLPNCGRCTRAGVTPERTSSRTARAATAARTRIWRCGSWATRGSATTSARGRNGAIGSTCRSKCRTVPTHMNQIIDFINANRDRYIDELKGYLAIPSISALPEAQGRRSQLRRVDRRRNAPHRPAELRLEETPGHPSSTASGWARRARRRCCSTATTTCSRSIRWICGSRRRSRPPSATARSTRAARPTTRARSSCTSRPSKRT